MIESDTKKEYEISYLLKTEEAAKNVLEFLKSQGADITVEGPVNKITLAYKIKNETSAYFGYAHFTASPAIIKPVSDALKMKPEILRTLIITPPFVKNRERRVMGRPRPQRPVSLAEKPSAPLSNEALEKKIEEILNK